MMKTQKAQEKLFNNVERVARKWWDKGHSTEVIVEGLSKNFGVSIGRTGDTITLGNLRSSVRREFSK